MEQTILRPTAEQRYADELAALRRWDVGNPKPENWRLSPRAVRLFLLGTGRGQTLEVDGVPPLCRICRRIERRNAEPP